MKYYIIFGLLLAVFLLLYFTRNVNAEVKESKPAKTIYKVIEITAAMGYECVTYQDPGIESRCDKIR